MVAVVALAFTSAGAPAERGVRAGEEADVKEMRAVFETLPGVSADETQQEALFESFLRSRADLPKGPLWANHTAVEKTANLRQRLADRKHERRRAAAAFLI